MITAQFNDSFSPISDGVANGVKNYAYWLNRKYGKAYVVVPEFPGYTDSEEFEVIRYKSIPLLIRKPYRIGLHNISFQTKKIIDEIHLDIIHARSPFSSGIFARQIARKKNIPFIATFHSQYYYDLKEKLLSERLTQQALQVIVNFYGTADAVWTVNAATVKTLRDYGYKGEIDIIKNGTDFEMPSDYNEIRHKIDEKYKIGKDEFVMLYTGQIIWHKNLKMIAESLAEVKNAGGDFKMFFVGMGAAEAELSELIESLGLGGNVIMTGLIDNREILKSMYARADLFLFPSVYDTFGLVVREAAALSCPSILIAGSNAAEEIRDMENGYLCENNRESFTKKIIDIMKNNSLLRKTGENAMKTLPDSWESIVDEAYLKYKDIIKLHAKTRKT